MTDRLPWWLEAGPESCSCCEATLHFELVTHCLHCDSPCCPLCVTELREETGFRCHACGEETE